MSKILEKLRGDDLRSIGPIDEVIAEVGDDQTRFDELFKGVFHNEPGIRMRAADGIQKIIVKFPRLLQKHKSRLIENLDDFEQSQVRWHIPLLFGALQLDSSEIPQIVDTLQRWFSVEKKSQIVKVNCLQGLADVVLHHNLDREWLADFIENAMETGSASVRARGRKLLKKLPR